MENINTEFRAFGKSMESISVYYGLFLIFWGIIISFIAESSSFTSYIPSYLGIVILLFSILSIKFPTKKKVLMHIVAIFGLITFLGGLDIIRLVIKSKLFDNFWADLSKITMLITGLCFLILCFKSFVHARKFASK